MEEHGELLALGLDRIQREPELLRAEAARLRSQIQEAAIRSCGAFVDVADAAEAMRAAVEAMGPATESTVEHLAAFQDSLGEDRAEPNSLARLSDELAESQERTRALYTKVQSVQPLIEIPSLLEACIRTGCFDEALDLQAFAGRLAIMHGGVPAVRALEAQCNAALGSFLYQIVGQLSGSLHLARCLRMLGYLKRVTPAVQRAEAAGHLGGDAGELAKKLRDLRSLFLECRDRWISDLRRDLDPRNAYEFLKRLTDLVRLQLFDVATQYRALFPDDDAAHLGAFVARQAQAYLATLKDHLGLISDAGSLASLLDHAMYAGSSLARVGCDFRPMLEPLFEGRATEVLRAHVAAAAAAFDALFTSHKWAAASGVGGAGSADAGPQGGAAALGRQGSAGSRGADATVAPPQDILEFPFLAALTNGILAGLNALRQLPAPRLRMLALAEVAAALQKAGMAIETAAGGSGGAAGGAGEERGAGRGAGPGAAEAGCERALACLRDKAVPHIAACYDALFPGTRDVLIARTAVT